MKKTLATILTIALTLALCAGLLVFPASAEQAATKDYATTKAEELWGSTQHKATSIKVTLTSLVTGVQNITFNIDAGTPVTLSEKGGFTAGTATLQDGVLTLDKVAYDTAAWNAGLEPNGATSIKITGGDFYGYIRNDNQLYAMDTGIADGHLLVTSDGHKFVGTGSGGNNLRARGSIVIYGNIAVDLQCPKGYHSVISENPGQGNEIIIAPEKDSILSVGGNGPVVENRSGSVTFAGKATITLKGSYTGTWTEKNSKDEDVTQYATKNGKQLVNLTSQAKAGSSVQFKEDVNVTFETAEQGAVLVDCAQPSGNKAIVFDTNGTVKFTSQKSQVGSWASVFMANKGSIDVNKGTILANVNVDFYSGSGSYHVFGMDNAGGDADGDLAATFTVANDAEIAAVVNSKATSAARLGLLWANCTAVTFKDNAKVSVGMNFATKGHGSTHMITVKVGSVTVTDNAKLFLADLPGSQGSQLAIQIQEGSMSDKLVNAWKGKMQYVQDGGQVEILTGGYAIANSASNKNPNPYESGLKLTGGIVSIISEAKVTFGKNPDAPAAPYYHTTTGYAYAGAPGKDKSNPNGRNVPEWVYMGEDDVYTPFNGLLTHAADLGLGNDYVATLLSKTANAVTAPANGNYKISGTGTVKLGDKTIPNNAIVTLKSGDVLSGEGIAIAMTKAAATFDPNASTNPPTADFAPVAAVITLISAVSIAGVIVLRKKANGAV